MTQPLYPSLPSPSAPRRVDVGAFLRLRVPLFKGLPPASLARLAASASTRSYSEGEFLGHAGEPARWIWVLLEGRVCVNRCGWSGGRVNLEIMVPGDVFGLPALSHWTSPSDIQALRPSLAAAIPREVALAETRRSPEFAQAAFSAIGQRLAFIESQLLLSREPVERRLIAALLYLRHKFGPVLPLTSAEIGEMAQTTPETTMRRLKALERAGLLRRGRGRVELPDKARLEARLRRGA